MLSYLLLLQRYSPCQQFLKTSQIINVMRWFYSVNPSHTINQCCPYSPSQSLSLCLIHNQVSLSAYSGLAPITHTTLIVQIFTYTNVSPLSPYFQNCEHKYDETYSSRLSVALVISLACGWLYKTNPPSHWLMGD